MDEGTSELGGRKREMLPRSGVVWLDALKLAHSMREGGCCSDIMLKELASDSLSHEPCHDIQDRGVVCCRYVSDYHTVPFQTVRSR
jgi:hypothetical protein